MISYGTFELTLIYFLSEWDTLKTADNLLSPSCDWGRGYYENAHNENYGQFIFQIKIKP